MSAAADGLSNQERGHIHLVCRLSKLHSSDFDVHVEYEPVGGFGRTGRKLVYVLYRASGRHRTYRAGTGNNWIAAFEEDIRAYCFTLFFLNSPSGRREAGRISRGE
jgi:hypothetical protein